MSDRMVKAACGCTIPLRDLGRAHVCRPEPMDERISATRTQYERWLLTNDRPITGTVDRDGMMRCGCGRRLVMAALCVRCRKEPDDDGNCKCDDLTVDE